MGDDTDDRADGAESKRPNANYRLSRKDRNPDGIVYHYDRDRRLEKAPQSVRDLYYGEEPRRRGFFRAGAGGKIQLVTMVLILLVSVLAMVTSFMGRDGDTHEFEGNLVTVQAIRYGGTVIIAMRKSVRSPGPFRGLRHGRPAYAGPVDIEVSPADRAGVSFHRVTFTGESPEFHRFAVPFDSDELAVVLSTENTTLSLRVRVE